MVVVITAWQLAGICYGIATLVFVASNGKSLLYDARSLEKWWQWPLLMVLLALWPLSATIGVPIARAFWKRRHQRELEDWRKRTRRN